MIGSATVLQQMLTLFQNKGFLSYDKVTPGKRTSAGLTLHEALRDVLNMKAEDSYYMYWEWPALKSALTSFWIEVDSAASGVLGRTTTAVAFAARPEVSQAEIEEVLRIADSSLIESFPIIHRRPTKSESQVRFVGKLLGACLQTLGIISTNGRIPFGEVLGQVADANASDEDLLVKLDGICLQIGEDVASLLKPEPVVLMRALGFAHQQMNKEREEVLDALTLSQFLQETDDNDPWSAFSDREALVRLLAIAPENAETSKLAISKFLGE